MNAVVWSAVTQGVDAVEVEIEAYCDRGTFPLNFEGLPVESERETSQRVLSAIAAFRPSFTGTGKTVRVTPLDVRKNGPAFDLPIALALVALAESVSLEVDDCFIVGEVAQDGAVRGVKGVLAIAMEAKRRGRVRLLVPEANASEAALVEGIEVFPIRSLLQAWKFLRGEETIAPFTLNETRTNSVNRPTSFDLDDIGGRNVRRVLEIAAAGNHHLLVTGSLTGERTSFVNYLALIFPEMTRSETVETTKIHSIAGLLDSQRVFPSSRPVRAPHYTTSIAGLFGGGNNPGPGEVTLAHHGVLVLNEIEELHHDAMKIMSRVLESGNVTVCDAEGTLALPACFLLVGIVGAGEHERITSALQDQIDLHVGMHRESSSTDIRDEPLAKMRDRVKMARDAQFRRFRGTPMRTNSEMNEAAIREHCGLDAGGADHMVRINTPFRLHDRILRLARTIADLEASESVCSHHVLEANHLNTLNQGSFA